MPGRVYRYEATDATHEWMFHQVEILAVDEGLSRPLAEGLSWEQDLFCDVFATEDARTGVASFLDHGPGKAEFRGR